MQLLGGAALLQRWAFQLCLEKDQQVNRWATVLGSVGGPGGGLSPRSSKGTGVSAFHESHFESNSCEWPCLLASKRTGALVVSLPLVISLARSLSPTLTNWLDCALATVCFTPLCGVNGLGCSPGEWLMGYRSSKLLDFSPACLVFFRFLNSTWLQVISTWCTVRWPRELSAPQLQRTCANPQTCFQNISLSLFPHYCDSSCLCDFTPWLRCLCACSHQWSRDLSLNLSFSWDHFNSFHISLLPKKSTSPH